MEGERSSFLRSIVGAAIGLCIPIAAWADTAPIHLEFRPSASVVHVNEPVPMGLWAYTSPGETQLFRALDMVFTWDSEFLGLDQLDSNGAVYLLTSNFPAGDPYGLNEVVPPQDGDGYYKAWAPLGEPIQVSTDGILLTTFMFTALQTTPAACVSIAADGGQPVLQTTVWGGPDANTIVTGGLGSVTIQIVPEPISALLAIIGGLLLARRRL